MTKLLTKEYPLIVLPALAKELGTTAAITLQQIHYWTEKKCGCVIDGVRWIYNTYKQWQEQMPHVSVSTIKRAIARLRNLNLILIEQHDKSQWNHRNHYTINYETLKALQLSISSNCDHQLGQSEPSGEVTLNQSSLSSENTTKTTTETPDVVVAQRCQCEEEIFEPTNEQIDMCITQIQVVSRDVQVNLSVRKAIALYWVSFPAALERLKKAVKENWRCNHTGVLVKALKEGVSEEAAPITIGFADWFNEGRKRDILWASYSEGSDIKVLFKSGAARLWSEIKAMSWEELAQ